MSRRSGAIAGSLGTVLVVAAVLLFFSSQRSNESSDRASVGGDVDGSGYVEGLGPPTLLAGGDEPLFPEEWRTTLADAVPKADFDTFVPDTSSALPPSDLTAVYAAPNGSAVILIYPPLTSSKGVRQNYIEIYQMPWTEKDDPLTFFKTELEMSPADGQEMSSLSDGTPVMTVQPQSISDLEQANPAYLEFVFNGTHIQISGGNSLEDLLDVANQLIRSA